MRELTSKKSYEEIRINDEDGKELTTIKINVADAHLPQLFQSTITKVDRISDDYTAQYKKVQKDLPENPEVSEMIPLFDLHVQACKDVGDCIDEMFGAGTVERMSAPEREINPDFVPDEIWYGEFLEMVMPAMEEIFDTHFKKGKKKYGVK